jgi:hypothetical protein
MLQRLDRAGKPEAVMDSAHETGRIHSGKASSRNTLGRLQMASRASGWPRTGGVVMAGRLTILTVHPNLLPA